MVERLIVVGAGHAGGQLVESARREGWEGEIVLLGEEPYLPYQRPPLSKKFLAGELALERTYFRPEAFYAKHAVEVRLETRALAIDPGEKTVELADGSRLSYSALALTTGSRVREVNLPGVDLSGVHYLRTLDDVLAIRESLAQQSRVVIVGGGYIGLEVAAVMATRGHQVTVLEMAERVMARVVAPAISEFYQSEHEVRGVNIVTGTTVSEFAGDAAVDSVLCADGSAYAADVVIVGVGILPNTALAESGSLACENGISVDELAQTSQHGIVAAGDCTWHPNAIYGCSLRLESVHNAVEQAKTAAATICGKHKPYNQVPWFWSDQYDLKLQIAGLTMGYDETVVRGNPDSRSFSVFYLRDGRLIACDSVNNPQCFMASRKLLANAVNPSRAQLADPDFVLKELL